MKKAYVFGARNGALGSHKLSMRSIPGLHPELQKLLIILCLIYWLDFNCQLDTTSSLLGRENLN